MSLNEIAGAERFQDQLLKAATRGNRTLAPEVEAAFRAVPRHAFVHRFYQGDKMIDVTPGTLQQFLSAIYADAPLTIWKDPASQNVSTISQPTLVLWMLNMLRLSPGQRVFELGAASGWNAALLGHLVGPQGHVVSAEIIPELAEGARKRIAERCIENVEIISGDGTDMYEAGAPFDRAVFTAGSFDLPRAFFEQVKVGGLLLFVMRVAAAPDLLFLLEKKEDHFASPHGMYCKFIPVLGKNAFPPGEAMLLAALPLWSELSEQEVERRPSAWGLPVGTPPAAALGVRSFLEISDPHFILFREEKEDTQQLHSGFFGLFYPKEKSLVLARQGSLITYGNTIARDALLARLHEWIDLGMPSTASMSLRVYSVSADVTAAARQWIVTREHAKLVWSA